MVITERGRGDAVRGLWAGWMVARLAPEREQALSGIGHYHRQFFEAGAAQVDGEAMAEAELSRMALEWGLEVVDLDGGEGGE